MTELIACLSEGEATREHVRRVINQEEWDKVVIITDKQEDFKADKEVDFILIDYKKLLPELIDEIKSKLKDRIMGTEVALNLISGTGKQHMAILSALLKLGVAIRLVALTKDGIKEV